LKNQPTIEVYWSRKYNNMVLYLLSTHLRKKSYQKGLNLAKTKTKRFRGRRTFGKGKKSGRGAGSRGGRGNSGLHKHKHMHMIKYMPDHFGAYGFKRPKSIVKKERIINIGQLEEMFPKKKDIDLTKEGFDKLLGGGNINSSLKIKVENASQSAVEKIKEKGGEVILPEMPKEQKKEQAK